MTKENNELIKLDNKNSHKNLSGYLEDHYNLVDSSYKNDLVPSMIYRYNAMNEDDFIWIGFPNSNNLNEDNEEWNNFTLIVCEDTEPMVDLQFVFDNIEDVLGFIESNYIIKG